MSGSIFSFQSQNLLTVVHMTFFLFPYVSVPHGVELFAFFFISPLLGHQTRNIERCLEVNCILF
jgi:hypothetical protein